MNRFRIAKVIIVFSSLSYLSITFLRNYNSPENIEKRCILKFEKDFFKKILKIFFLLSLELCRARRRES